MVARFGRYSQTIAITFLSMSLILKEMTILLFHFSILLIILLLLEIGTIIASLIANQDIIDALSSHMLNDITNYNEPENGIDPETSFKDMYRIDFLQLHLKCCGINSFNDWKSNTVLSQSDSVPDTCCISLSNNCGMGAINKLVTNQINQKGDEMDNEIYLMGCIRRIEVLFEHNCLVIGLIVIGILGIQISAIFLSWCLSEQMKGRWWNYRYTKKEYTKRNDYKANKCC